LTSVLPHLDPSMFSTRSREPNDGPEIGRRDVSSDLPTTSIRENDVLSD